MLLNDKLGTINTHIELALFITELKSDLANNGKTWANISLVDYLEALSAWVEDMEGYYCNNNLPVPVQPTWRTIAEMLLAAKVYE